MIVKNAYQWNTFEQPPKFVPNLADCLKIISERRWDG
jgi:hypothetical protein